MSDVGNVPLDQFQTAFCRVCGNRACSRSSLNNSIFDRRVRNWEKILFTEVPRASDDDPRYSNIRAKLFSPVGGHPYEVREAREPAYVAPPAGNVPNVQPVPASRPVPPQAPRPAPVAVPEPEGKAARGAEEPPRPAAKPVPDVANTPFTQGSMVSGKDKDVVLEPGGTYVLEDE